MPQFPNPMGPYQSLEELQRLAYQQPQRVKTTLLNPNVGDETSFEEESVIQPGWQKSAALDALKRTQGMQYASEDADIARIEQIRGAQQDSKLSGFDTPQAQGQYERRIGEEKMRQPIAEQNIIRDTQQSVTRMQGENQLAGIRLQGQQQIDRQDRSNAFVKLMQGQNNGTPGNPPVKRISNPTNNGGGGIEFDTNPQAPVTSNSALLQRVQQARGALAVASNDASENNYYAAVSNALLDSMQKGLMSSEVVQTAMEIARDPQQRDLPIEQLLEEFNIDDPVEGPKRMQELQTALMIVGGR